MGLWIKDSELEVFRIDGIDARFYLKRISRGALIKAQEIEELRAIELTPKSEREISREQREIQAEQRAEHDAKPLDERIEAELLVAYAGHDRKTILNYGLVRVDEEAADGGTTTTENVNWLEVMDATVCEKVFRALVQRNAVLPSRVKA